MNVAATHSSNFSAPVLFFAQAVTAVKAVELGLQATIGLLYTTRCLNQTVQSSIANWTASQFTCSPDLSCSVGPTTLFLAASSCLLVSVGFFALRKYSQNS